MIYLEVPKKLRMLVNQARQTADHVFRPSHANTTELNMITPLNSICSRRLWTA